MLASLAGKLSSFDSVVTGSCTRRQHAFRCLHGVQGGNEQVPHQNGVLRWCQTSHGIAEWFHGHRTTDGSTVISRLVGTALRPQHPDVLRCQTSSPL